MKIFRVFLKSLKEQTRHFWTLVLTISMAPIFVFIYFLMMEYSKPGYSLTVVNLDEGTRVETEAVNHGELLLKQLRVLTAVQKELNLEIRESNIPDTAVEQLKSMKTDAVIEVPPDFSEILESRKRGDPGSTRIRFYGDLTNMKYLIAAVFANEYLNVYVKNLYDLKNPVEVVETSVGISGDLSEFDILVPGLIILSIIMLMFSASIALVEEVENSTLLRLKLSKVSVLEYLTGVSMVQVIIGTVSVLLTFSVSVSLGFSYKGSLLLMILICVLTSISIVAFSLIIAAFTKSAREVLVVGNFPLFLFMFFSGAAFPLGGKTLFHLFGYPVTWQGLMSPTHAVVALKKVLISGFGITRILPEMACILILTLLYFLLGAWAFKKRHMKVL